MNAIDVTINRLESELEKVIENADFNRRFANKYEEEAIKLKEMIAELKSMKASK